MYFFLKVSPLPCHAVGPYSCKRLCGRMLRCQNHTCMKECHKVTEVDSSTGKNKVTSLGRSMLTVSLKHFKCDTTSFLTSDILLHHSTHI